MNHYEIFKVKAHFIFNKKLVDPHYFQLLKQCHPDHIRLGSSLNKEEALQQSQVINQAYKILINWPLALAYFLEVFHTESIQVEDPKSKYLDLIETFFELDSSQKKEAELLKIQITEKINGLKNELFTQFESSDLSTPERKQLILLKSKYQEYKYLNSLKENVENLCQSL